MHNVGRQAPAGFFRWYGCVVASVSASFAGGGPARSRSFPNRETTKQGSLAVHHVTCMQTVASMHWLVLEYDYSTRVLCILSTNAHTCVLALTSVHAYCILLASIDTFVILFIYVCIHDVPANIINSVILKNTRGLP